MQTTDLLIADFRMLSCQDIKWALNGLKGHYAITRKALCDALKKLQDSGDASGKRRRSRTLSERCYVDFQFEHGTLTTMLFKEVVALSEATFSRYFYLFLHTFVLP